jgi:hypothetical protein
MEVTFSETTIIHRLPPEDRTNFEIFDIIRERLRVNKLWLSVINNIKQQLWRMGHPKIKKRKRMKEKKRLKEVTRYIIKQDMSP